ncbi:MAG: hypothetical protein OXU23_12770 [Candidatus Poribacteria bacterium]|nr:hypothetical protein [Candidatus Poribacteria bacterium]
MNDETTNYKYKGKYLDKCIAAELIIGMFEGKQGIQRKIIGDQIIKIHIDRGGLPHGNDNWSVTLALEGFKALRFADNPDRGKWNILTIDEMITRLEYL